jgi:hypothetical protein
MRRGVIRFMKTTIAPICLVLSLALGFSTPAVADHGRHGSYRGGHYGGHYAAQRYHHHPGHYRQDRWVAPAAVLALTGIAAGVAAATLLRAAAGLRGAATGLCGAATPPDLCRPGAAALRSCARQVLGLLSSDRAIPGTAAGHCRQRSSCLLAD